MKDADECFAGLDVGARRLHLVVVDRAGRVAGFTELADIAEAADLWDRVRVVAIDAPDAPSTAPHADDARLSPKFRRARCGEVELGRARRIWVPWVTPTGPPFAGWILRGLAAHAALRASGCTTLETYPHAAFVAWNRGRRPPSKRTPAGRAARATLLRRAGLLGEGLETWDHDRLDAAAAALVARDHALGRGVPVTCGHDGSAIWLPA